MLAEFFRCIAQAAVDARALCRWKHRAVDQFQSCLEGSQRGGIISCKQVYLAQPGCDPPANLIPAPRDSIDQVGGLVERGNCSFGRMAESSSFSCQEQVIQCAGVIVGFAVMIRQLFGMVTFVSLVYASRMRSNFRMDTIFAVPAARNYKQPPQ